MAISKHRRPCARHADEQRCNQRSSARDVGGVVIKVFLRRLKCGLVQPLETLGAQRRGQHHPSAQRCVRARRLRRWLKVCPHLQHLDRPACSTAQRSSPSLWHQLRWPARRRCQRAKPRAARCSQGGRVVPALRHGRQPCCVRTRRRCERRAASATRERHGRAGRARISRATDCLQRTAAIAAAASAQRSFNARSLRVVCDCHRAAHVPESRCDWRSRSAVRVSRGRQSARNRCRPSGARHSR